MQISVLEYLEEKALREHASAIAVVDGDELYTFSQIASLARKCSFLIDGLVEDKSQPIAVYLPKSVWTIIADLGVLYSGNIYANLDLRTPAARQKKILDNVAPVLIITDSQSRTALRDLGVDDHRILCVEDIADANVAPSYSPAGWQSRIDTDPMCLISTSGSTGVPKSVVMHHRSVIDFIDWVTGRFPFDENTVIGSLSPFYFDIYTLELYVALARGCRIVIVPESLAAFPVKLVEFLARHKVSFIFWVPTIMVNMANLDVLNAADLSPLKTVFFAGEVFPTRHLNHWRRQLPQSLFVNLYGPIEITVDCTYFVVDREMSDDEPLPIGFPCRNTDVLVLNDDDRPAGINEPGELCIRGSSLALGYWNNPEQTARAFVQNPLRPHYPELIYRTGDIVSRNERGELMFKGRRDFQIKHLGYRIELSEIELAASSIRNMRNVCVLYDREKREIIMFYEASEEISAAAVRGALALLIPKYMIPTVFHRLDGMPRNPNGKIDRLALTRQLQGVP
jgi:amino acid adenylation domain-containing protein